MSIKLSGSRTPHWGAGGPKQINMPNKPNLLNAILLTGLIAGTMDATAASIQFYINTGKDPALVFRYIASAVFKDETKTGSLYGWAAVGLLFHYLIAMTWTVVFYLLFKPIRSILTNKYVAGIVYAAFVWCVMNLIVVPVAFNRPIHLIAKNALIAYGILVIAIGLPISLMADWYYRRKAKSV